MWLPITKILITILGSLLFLCMIVADIIYCEKKEWLG